MAEPKKKHSVPAASDAASDAASTASSHSPPFSDLLSKEELDRLSTLQVLDLVASKLPPRHSALIDLAYFRDRVASLEDMNDQARQAIEKYDDALEKLRAPALRIGTFLQAIEPDRAHVCLGGADYVCRVDPQLPLSSLQVGQR